MKTPDLSFNNYYPFYRQKTERLGKKLKRVKTMVHLSSSKVILINIVYHSKKFETLEIKLVTDQELIYGLNNNNNRLISYQDLADTVKEVFKIIGKCNRDLRNNLPYNKVFCGYHYFERWSSGLKSTCSSDRLYIEKGEFLEKIVNGKAIKDHKIQLIDGDDEDSKWMKRVVILGESINDYTSYKEISEAKYEEFLSYFLDKITPYFEAPKFIRKKEYKLTN